MVYLYTALGVLLFVLLLLYCASEYFFSYAVKKHKPFDYGAYLEKHPDNPAVLALIEQAERGKRLTDELPCRAALIKSADNLRLHGVFLEPENYNGITVILAHGYRSGGFADLGGAAAFYTLRGCRCLLIDLRCCGKSEGKYITFGAMESRDICAWSELCAAEAGCEKIILHGISLGASSVMMSLSLGLPDKVCGIVADCGFTSADDIFRHVIRRNFRLPPFPFVDAASVLCRLRAGFNPKENSTVDILASCSVPVLFIHGSADTFVPTEMSLRNYDAHAGVCELFIVKGARHAESFARDEEGCREAVCRLVKQATGVELRNER